MQDNCVLLKKSFLSLSLFLPLFIVVVVLMKHHVCCHSNDLQRVFFGNAIICCDTGAFFSSFVFYLIAFVFLNCSMWTSVRQTTLQQSKVIHFWSAIQCIIMTTHVIYLSEFHFSTIKNSLSLFKSPQWCQHLHSDLLASEKYVICIFSCHHFCTCIQPCGLCGRGNTIF